MPSWGMRSNGGSIRAYLPSPSVPSVPSDSSAATRGPNWISTPGRTFRGMPMPFRAACRRFTCGAHPLRRGLTPQQPGPVRRGDHGVRAARDGHPRHVQRLGHSSAPRRQCPAGRWLWMSTNRSLLQLRTIICAAMTIAAVSVRRMRGPSETARAPAALACFTSASVKPLSGPMSRRIRPPRPNNGEPERSLTQRRQVRLRVGEQGQIVICGRRQHIGQIRPRRGRSAGWPGAPARRRF